MTNDGWTLVLHTNNIQINTYGKSTGIVYTPTNYSDAKFLDVPPTNGLRFSCKANAVNTSWTQDAIITNTDPAKALTAWNYLSSNKTIGCGLVLGAAGSSGWVYNGVAQTGLIFNDGMRNITSDNDFWFNLDGLYFG